MIFGLVVCWYTGEDWKFAALWSFCFTHFRCAMHGVSLCFPQSKSGSGRGEGWFVFIFFSGSFRGGLWEVAGNHGKNQMLEKDWPLSFPWSQKKSTKVPVPAEDMSFSDKWTGEDCIPWPFGAHSWFKTWEMTLRSFTWYIYIYFDGWIHPLKSLF